jgi:hypothetical protein
MRAFSYLFHGLLALFLLAISAVAWSSGGPAPLDQNAIFSNSNIGGLTSVTFTAHIDSAWAYNPIGALLHWIIDVLGSNTRNPCP